MGSHHSSAAPAQDRSGLPVRSETRDHAQYLEDEAACVERMRGGDEQAFELIFRAYFRPLRAYVARLIGSTDDADEVAQQVLLGLWERRQRVTIHDTLRPYLFHAARNRALNVLRHTDVQQRGEAVALRNEMAFGMGESPRSAQEALEQEELAVAVQRAVESLPPRCREVYTLRWVHGLSRAEVAKALGLSMRGVEAQITRAMRTLRVALTGL